MPLALVAYVMNSMSGGSSGGDRSGYDRRGRGAERAGEQEKAKPERVPCNVLPPGTRMQVGGLQSAPELNGTRGGVISYNAEKGRYIVQLAAKSHNGEPSAPPPPAPLVLLLFLLSSRG